MPKKSAPAKTPPTPQKILSLLSSSGVTKERICKVLSEGLDSTKPIVCDGEIISYEPDYAVRHKYVETILDVIGEKRLVVPEGELHFHFTNILQLAEAYERGDPRAVKDAGRIFEASAVQVGQVADEPEDVFPGSPGSEADVEASERTSGSVSEGAQGA